MFAHVTAGDFPNNYIYKFSDAGKKCPEAPGLHPHCVGSGKARHEGIIPRVRGGVGGGTVAALRSPKGRDSCDSSEPKTFANLDYIRPVVCQRWSEYIPAAATLHQQSPGAAAQPELTGNRPIILSVTRTGPTQKAGNLQMKNADGPEASSVLRIGSQQSSAFHDHHCVYWW